MSKAQPYLLYILCLVFLFFTMRFSYGSIRICLVGRSVKILPSYGRSFMNGALLAKNEYKDRNKIKISTYFYNNNPLEPIKIYQKMQRDKCSAMIGYVYLNDLLLTLTAQKTKNVPIFTSFASTLGKNNLPKNVFVFMPSYQFLAGKMINFLIKKQGNLKNVLLITEANRKEMLDYQKAYSTLLKKHNIPFSQFNFLEYSNFSPQLKKFIKSHGKYRYVFLLANANDAAKCAKLLRDQNPTFVGTEYFGSSSDPSFTVALKTNQVNGYISRNLDFTMQDKPMTQFKNKYIKTFHAYPTILSAYTYDAVKLITNTLNRYGSISTNNLLKIQYRGITGVTLKNGQFIRSPKYVILKITPNGYTLVQQN